MCYNYLDEMILKKKKKKKNKHTNEISQRFIGARGLLHADKFNDYSYIFKIHCKQ